jgi:hypothetical protein
LDFLLFVSVIQNPLTVEDEILYLKYFTVHFAIAWTLLPREAAPTASL